jgi:pilus assembly protein CpaE
MTLKVSAICATEETLREVNTTEPVPTDAVFKALMGSAQTLSSVLRRNQPDVVLLEFPHSDETAMQQIEAALVKSPGTHMVLVSPNQTVELLTRAMRAGVREVLPAPMTRATVQLAIKHAQGHALVSHEGERSSGEVIALIAAKGGAGATFLSANLAYALSKLEKRVAVIDLNLYFGDLIMFLGSYKVASSLFDLARQTQRLDSALLDSSMIKISDFLHVLPASDTPEHANDVSTEGIEKIIELASNNYDFVILDLCSTLDSVTVKALDMADHIYLTMQPSLPSLNAAKRILSFFHGLGYGEDKLSIIVNRYEKGSEISLGDVEKATLSKIYRTIQNSYVAVSSSVNQGIPLLELNPRDPVARSLQEWANELAPSPEKPKKSWFQELLAH